MIIKGILTLIWGSVIIYRLLYILRNAWGEGFISFNINVGAMPVFVP